MILFHTLIYAAQTVNQEHIELSSMTGSVIA